MTPTLYKQIIIAFIALIILVITFFYLRHIVKKDREMMEKERKKDIRDVTERMFDDEVFPEAFKRKVK